MQRKKKPSRSRFPTKPPPGDPKDYIWIITKEGGYWRKKRGTVKPARLNASLQLNANTTRLTNDAAKKMVQRLQPFLEGLATGRLTARIGGKLKQALAKNKRIDFSFFWKFDVQAEYPLRALLRKPYSVSIYRKEAIIKIPIQKRTVVLPKRGATDYYFEAISLWGDSSEDNALRVDSISSPLFPLKCAQETTCEVVIPVPDKKPYMIFLKLSCVDGNALATQPCFFGMQVIQTG
jgi:hypothetical protein